MFEHLGADPLAVDGRGSSALGHILLNKSTSWTDADIIALLTTALRHVRDKNALATFLAAVGYTPHLPWHGDTHTHTRTDTHRHTKCAASVTSAQCYCCGNRQLPESN